MDKTVKRWDAAIEQLMAGLDCYERGLFIPAITLAGAAEELLNQELAEKRPDLKTAWEADKNVLEFFETGNVTESVKGVKDKGVRKLASDALAVVRNFLKHGAERETSFDPEFEAADRLQRCVDMVHWMTGNRALANDWDRRLRFLHKPKSAQ